MTTYREPDTTAARFICTVCFRTVSSAGGRCARCGVDQLPLTNDQVLDELRKYAEAKTQRARRWRLALLTVGSLALALAIYIPIGRALGIDLFWAPRAFQLRYMPVNPIFIPIWVVVLLPLARWQQRKHPDRNDVMTLGASDLLRLLGLSVDKK